jgi:hypothetical protein
MKGVSRMTESELLHLMCELENHLFSREFDRWAKAQPGNHREQIRALRTKVYALRGQLQAHRSPDLSGMSPDCWSQLESVMRDLRRKAYAMARLAELDDALDRVTATATV